MASLIYAPAIRVHVQTSTGLLDLTEDITSCGVDLRENAIHSFNFQLQNAQRKYDARFFANDRISIQMKRIKWVEVMTGYLNDSPFFQAWPGTLDLSASCTLKIPQYWSFDPTSIEFTNLIVKLLGDTNSPGQFFTDSEDHGLHKVIIESLSTVTGWNRKKIHVGQVPENWFKFAQKVGDRIETELALDSLVGKGALIGGQAPNVQVQLPSGSYAGTSLNDRQAANASAIYNTARVRGRGSISTTVATLMTAMQESSLLNTYSSAVPGSSAVLPNDGPQRPNYDSCGLFQQRPSWGSVTERMNPVTSTQLFVQAYLSKFPPGDTVDQRSGKVPTDALASKATLNDRIQAVQVSGNPDAYGKWYDLAVAIVTVLDTRGKSSGSGAAAFGGSANIGSEQTASAGTGAGFMQTAVAQVNSRLKSGDPIRYVFGAPESNAHDPNPLSLDCSLLVEWAYYHSTGGKDLHLRNTIAQYGACTRAGTVVPVEIALKVQGALLFGEFDGSGPQHVGISLGDGLNHVAAHTDGVPLDQQVTVAPAGTQFSAGGLLPSLDYAQSATDQQTADALTKTLALQRKDQSKGIQYVVGPNLTDLGGGDVTQITGTTSDSMAGSFGALINNWILGNLDNSGLGNILPKEKALMNDTFFLPWLANIVNASMRSFCAAPNGDFISWFPDYFGLWGTAAKFQIEPIELQNFDIKFSDQQMVTHQFVIGSPVGAGFDATSGSTSFLSGLNDIGSFLRTQGVATMDFPEIFEAIYGKPAPEEWTQAFLKRFGGRPQVDMLPNVPSGKAEFLMALYLFARRWASMFQTQVPLTFMPELFPGMLLQIPEFGFQAYVTGVHHSVSFGQGGSFTTTVDIIAPTSIAGASRKDLLSLLPQLDGSGF